MCAACNTRLLVTGALHASCCALSEATRRHNAVAQIAQEAAHECDHPAETEVPGLIPGTGLRPADVVTSAIGNALTALDVCICSPHPQEAGLDRTQSIIDSKLAHYGSHFNTLVAQNIDYAHRLECQRQTPFQHVDSFPHSQQVHLAQV